jgi:hypothetical protein
VEDVDRMKLMGSREGNDGEIEGIWWCAVGGLSECLTRKWDREMISKVNKELLQFQSSLSNFQEKSRRPSATHPPFYKPNNTETRLKFHRKQVSN